MCICLGNNSLRVRDVSMKTINMFALVTTVTTHIIRGVQCCHVYTLCHF
jgi:hypothetical protein